MCIFLICESLFGFHFCPLKGWHDGFICGGRGRWSGGGNDIQSFSYKRPKIGWNRFSKYVSMFSTALCRLLSSISKYFSRRLNRKPPISFPSPLPSQTKVGEWMASVWILSWLYKHIILLLPPLPNHNLYWDFAMISNVRETFSCHFRRI